MPKPSTVDAYIDGLDRERAELVRRLRHLVLATVPDSEEAMKWAHPTYATVGPFCYIKAFPRYVNLGFWRGAALDDPAGVVRSGGEKMGHIRVTSTDDIRVSVFRKLIRQAAALNRELGDPSRTR
jgi:hypothetical protein